VGSYFQSSLKFVQAIIIIIIIIVIVIIIIIFLHGLGHLTHSGIDALPSFAGASTISSSSRFVDEGVSKLSYSVIY
jgi:preprotein translocase subunit SecG